MTDLTTKTSDLRIANALSDEALCVSENSQSTYSRFMNKSVYLQDLYLHDLKTKFDYFAKIWKSETIFESSSSKIQTHYAYRKIIELGIHVVPFIIEDLKNSDSHWFYALEVLTGAKPVHDDHRGRIAMMKQDWIEWAKRNI